MANISSTSQLGISPREKAASLTRNLGISSSGTQPVPMGGPSVPNNRTVAGASLFSASLGGSSTQVSVLGAIAEKVVGTPRLNKMALVQSATYTDEVLDGASSYFADGGVSVKGSTFSDQGLADVSNAAFSVGSADLKLPGLEGEGALSYLQDTSGGDIPKDWLFITAPQSVSWDKQGETALVNTYGSNNPYVIYSTTGMRKLSLSDCLVEGFSAGKEVEGHVLKLEKLMTTVMNTEKGYVSPYVWDLRAGDKSYGKFIIESMNIKEDMRNAKGRADRATVSISLQQVPDFQINDGRDLATKADLASGTSLASEDKDKESKAANAKAGKAGDKVKSGSGSGSGSGSQPGTANPSDKPPAPAALPPATGAQRL